MDEFVFRSARDAMAPRPCAFQNAMLAGACACSLAARRNIAEREAVTCTSSVAREQCAELRALLRQSSAFALKLTHTDRPLPHAAEMKVECGGLLGVHRAAARADGVPAPPEPPALRGQGLAPAAAGECASLADVHGLVRTCAEKFGGLAQLPFSAIVQDVVAFQVRRRRPAQ